MRELSPDSPAFSGGEGCYARWRNNAGAGEGEGEGVTRKQFDASPPPHLTPDDAVAAGPPQERGRGIEGETAIMETRQSRS